jgi:hypothetical protein
MPNLAAGIAAIRQHLLKSHLSSAQDALDLSALTAA